MRIVNYCCWLFSCTRKRVFCFFPSPCFFSSKRGDSSRGRLYGGGRSHLLFVSPHFPYFSFRMLLLATVPELDNSSGTPPQRKSFSVSQIHREIQIIIGSMKKTVQLRGRFFCFLGSDLFYLKLPSRSFSMAVYRAVQTRKKRYNMIIFFAHFREETFSAAKNKGKNLRE